MKKILLALLLTLYAAQANAQIMSPQILEWAQSSIMFDHNNGNTVAEAEDYTVTYYVNNKVEILPMKCSPNNVGAAAPSEINPNKWGCTTALPALVIGNNIITITLSKGTLVSPKSNPFILFYAVQQIVKESTTVIECKPGTYAMDRFTDANKIIPITNARTNHIVSIGFTANAIYVFSCTLK